MNRNKRRYMRATRKSIRHSCLAEYWAWRAKLAHSSEVENAVEQTLSDVLEFAKCSSDGRSASMPQIPVNRVGKERFVVISQRWKRYMTDVGSHSCRLGNLGGIIA